MDSQVKERIIGAVVLVALGVWLIPWVLDGPARAPVEDEPALELPAADAAAPVRTEIVELGRGAVRPAATEPSTARSNAAAPRARAPEPPSDAGRDEAAQSAANALGNTEAAASANRGAADSAPNASSEVSASSSPRAAAGPSAAEGAARGAWMVQLGSFGEVGNAERLAERVSTYGYSARVSAHTAGGRTLHRVRIAGYASRNEAEAAVASLQAHGFVAQVVTPE